MQIVQFWWSIGKRLNEIGEEDTTTSQKMKGKNDQEKEKLFFLALKFNPLKQMSE